jgi:large subunit ribosomal protein L15
MPLARRLPKRGFRNPFRHVYAVVNLQQLEGAFDPNGVVNPETLSERGLVRRGWDVKVLAKGALTKPLSVSAHAFSHAAQERIASAGGSVEVIARA